MEVRPLPPCGGGSGRGEPLARSRPTIMKKIPATIITGFLGAGKTSLVRHLVELHGGKVQVDSVVGKGTVVTCDFPTDQAAHRDAAE